MKGCLGWNKLDWAWFMAMLAGFHRAKKEWVWEVQVRRVGRGERSARKSR